jgi:hypothetical protein
MDWRKRMRELICAGGAAALAGCAPSGPSGPPGGSCNANPDPCCSIVNNEPPGNDLRKECDLRDACERAGGNWSDPYIQGFMTDAGTPHCIFGDLDAGTPDYPPPDAGPVPDAYLPPPPPDAH